MVYIIVMPLFVNNFNLAKIIFYVWLNMKMEEIKGGFNEKKSTKQSKHEGGFSLDSRTAKISGKGFGFICE